jgi:epoxyqueuosine reductase
MDACPTDAIVEPRRVDARRCISYLTIEQRGEIPEQFREAIAEAGLVYGCDICQEVCPWNVRFAQELREDSFAPRDFIRDKDAATLARDLLALSQEEFSAAFKNSPMKRAKLRGVKRNATVVLGNVGTADDVGLLERVCHEEPDEMLREHAAWALEQLRR